MTVASHTTKTGLEAAAICVKVGDRTLVRDLSFAVGPGEAVAVAGPSGSGKTTILRSLARLRDPDAGSVTLHGRAAEEIGFPAYRRAVVYAAQRAAVVAGSVEHNLAIPFGFASARRAFPRSAAEALLAAMGLQVGLDAEAARLSEGERQRVGLARALLVEPEVLLLDEPTSALDPAARERVEALLVERREAGAALVLVSHDEAQIERLTDRRIVLEAHD